MRSKLLIVVALVLLAGCAESVSPEPEEPAITGKEFSLGPHGWGLFEWSPTTASVLTTQVDLSQGSDAWAFVVVTVLSEGGLEIGSTFSGTESLLANFDRKQLPGPFFFLAGADDVVSVTVRFSADVRQVEVGNGASVAGYQPRTFGDLNHGVNVEDDRLSPQPRMRLSATFPATAAGYHLFSAVEAPTLQRGEWAAALDLRKNISDITGNFAEANAFPEISAYGEGPTTAQFVTYSGDPARAPSFRFIRIDRDPESLPRFVEFVRP